MSDRAINDVSAERAEEIEERARDRLAAADDASVQAALDQLVADRTNGEPLDTAYRRLHDALATGDAREEGKSR